MDSLNITPREDYCGVQVPVSSSVLVFISVFEPQKLQRVSSLMKSDYRLMLVADGDHTVCSRLPPTHCGRPHDNKRQHRLTN